MKKITLEEILKEKPKLRDGTILIVKMWKTKHYKGWSDLGSDDKMQKLEELISSLVELYRKKQPKIVRTGTSYYDKELETIYINEKHPSIVTTLHETAHHIFKNSSELTASRWSIWIYKEVFPITFKKMEWRDGQLKLKVI